MNKLLLELVAIGLLTMVIGVIIAYGTGMFGNQFSRVCRELRFSGLAFLLFLTGVSIHLFCEVSGVNKWYCKNGNACQ